MSQVVAVYRLRDFNDFSSNPGRTEPVSLPDTFQISQQMKAVTGTMERCTPKVQVVRATGEHAAAMAAFFRVVWDEQATAERVRSSRESDAVNNPGAFGEEAPSYLFLDRGAVVGYVGSIPTRIWSGGREHRAHWIKGLMVLPEYQRGPVGFSVLKEASLHLPRAMAAVVNPAARRIFTALGYIDHGALPNDLLLLRPARLLSLLDVDALGLGGLPRVVPRAIRLMQRTGASSVVGACLSGALSTWRRGIGLLGRARGLVPAAEAAPPETLELDSLWRRSRTHSWVGQIRDGSYIKWRYGQDASVYEFLSLRRAGELQAIAIVRRPSTDGDPRLKNIRVATLADMLYPADDPSIGLALLQLAEEAARASDADALLSSATSTAIRALTSARCYLRIPGNVHLLTKDTTDSGILPASLSDWWLMRGDSEADGVF